MSTFFIASSKSEIEAVASFVLIGLFVVAGIIAGIVKSVQESRHRKYLQQRGDYMYKRFKEWSAAVQASNGLSPVEVELPLKKGERAYLRVGATLCETRAVRTARHGGGAIRIARGVTIGQGRSRSESHEEWRAIASGYLYITNQRIIFDGDMQSRNINLSDVISVQYDANSLQIATSKRQKTMVFTGLNGYIANAVTSSIISSQESNA